MCAFTGWPVCVLALLSESSFPSTLLIRSGSKQSNAPNGRRAGLTCYTDRKRLSLVETRVDVLPTSAIPRTCLLLCTLSRHRPYLACPTLRGPMARVWLDQVCHYHDGPSVLCMRSFRPLLTGRRFESEDRQGRPRPESGRAREKNQFCKVS
jgi:hypothetical protein